MERTLFLSDRDKNKKQDSASIGYKKGVVEIRDADTGEVLFKGTNKVVIAGAAFTATKHFDIPRDEITPSYNDALGLENTVHEVPNPLDIEKCYLFSVGIDGGGAEPSQVYPVKYAGWCAPEHLVPFRYQPANQDLPESLRDSYFGRKVYDLQGRVAYYFKAFDTDPIKKQQWVDGTPINSEIYESQKTDEVETFVELRLKITKEDCREFFTCTTGINSAKINTISLLTAWPKEIDGHIYYQDIRPLTKLNFPLESLIDLTKSIEIIYHLYY